jgi:class 3 adenylate cyclase/tetratricopeptide (TPR) repeat protein
VYDELLKPLHARGGSVVYFSGDSITCFLAEETGEKMVHVALQMQSAMRALRRASHDEFGGIGLKVAVGYGEVFRAEVGDPSIQLLEALSGGCLNRVAAAEAQAQLGDVVITPHLYAKLQTLISRRDTRTLGASNGNDAPGFVIDGLTGDDSIEPQPSEALSISNELLKPRIHPLVRARLESGTDEFIAEIRLTSPVFIQFDGLDCGTNPSAKAHLNRFVTLVQGVAQRYEGAVLSLTMGEKGSYLYLNFGALLLHPDDAARAVGAALEIVDLKSMVPEITSIRAGVSSGRVRVGAYGGRERRVYGALGDEVNLAARLMMHSEANQVTVSEAAVLAAKGAYEFRSRGEITVKGKTAPVAIYSAMRLTGAQAPVSATKASETLVGREREKVELLSFAQSDPSHGSLTLLLEGEAGVGKSMLLGYLHQALEAASVTVLAGAGNSIEKTTPYHVLGRALSDLLNMASAPCDSVERRAYVEAQLPEDPSLRRRAPLLRSVLNVEWKDNEFTAELEGEVRKTNTEELLLSMFKAAAMKNRMALVLEDAHWFDSSSWDFLRRLCTEVPGFLVAVTSRVESEMPDTVVTTEQVKHFLGETGTHLRLQNLERSDVALLLSQCLRVDDLPPYVLDLIVDQAGGHPFYSMELAFALRDAGLLFIEGREARLVPGAAHSLLEFRPGNVEAAITSRVDRLKPELQTTLKVASVAGREFDMVVVEQVLKQGGSLRGKLQSLSERGFLESDENGGYRFKHALTQAAVYGLMLFSQRQKIHAELGEWLERERGNSGPHMPPVLAYHFERAAQFERAAPYLEQAGAHALKANANREALGFFQRALKLVPNAPAHIRGRYLRCLGDANELLGKLRESQSSSEEALRLLNLAPPRNTVTLMAQICVQILYRGLRRLMANFGDPIRDQERLRLMEAARAHLRLCQVYYYTGQNFNMLHSGLAQLNLADRAGDSRELAQAYSIMAAVATTIPMPGLAKDWGDAGLQVAQRLADRPTIAFVKLRQSFYSLCVCDFAQACKDLQDSRQIFLDLGDWRSVEMCCAMLGAAKEIRGEFRASCDFWQAAQKSGENRGALQSIGFGLQGVGLARYRMEEGDEPLHILERADNILSDSGSLTHQYQVRGVLAEACSERGDYERALNLASEAERVLGYARPNTFYIMSGYSGVVHALLGVWSQDKGSRALETRVRKALGVLQKFSSVFSFAEGRAALYSGRYFLAQGKSKQALSVFNKGIVAAVHRKMPYDEALLRIEIARLNNGLERRAQLGRAQVLLERHEARRDLSALRKELSYG